MKTKYITKTQLKERVEYRFITSEDKPSDLVLWWEWDDREGLTPKFKKVWKVRLANGSVETLPNIVPKLFVEATV
jgi:hypothetical protein